jgi:hypothetical protein
MPREKTPRTVVRPRDVLQDALEGGTPARHTDGDMASHTDGMTKVTYRLPEALVEALRRHYLKARLEGQEVTMSAIVEAALRAYLEGRGGGS